MRGYMINHYAHPKNLTLSLHLPEPTPGPGEVLVDIYSAALNFFDVNTSSCHVQIGRR
jgi:NADPH:quinone reductase